MTGILIFLLLDSRKIQAEKDLGAEFSSFDNLLENSDYIAVCCALTPETQDMFDYTAFSKMKPTAVRNEIIYNDSY
jgi:glyoxylate/hydroxypyruvate reductase